MKFPGGFKKPKPSIRVRIETPASSPAFSYYSSNRGSTAETKGHSGIFSSKLFSRIFSLAITLVVLSSLLYGSTLSSTPRIVLYGTKPTIYREKQEYEQAAQKIISQHILNNLKVSFNASRVAADLQAQFPEIQKVESIVPIVGRRPILGLTISTPSILLRSGAKTFIVDDSGKIVLPVSTNELPLIEVIDQSGLPVSVGSIPLGASSSRFIKEVVAQLDAKNMIVSTVTLPPIANEIHVRILGQPYYIKFNLNGDAREQSGAFLAAKQKFDTDQTPPAEYVDVRVEEKVYLK